MKQNLILYTTTALLITLGGQSAVAQAQRQQQLKKKSFSPKMLVYENLKNEQRTETLQPTLRTTRHSHQKPYMGESTSHRTGTQ